MNATERIAARARARDAEYRAACQRVHDAEAAYRDAHAERSDARLALRVIEARARARRESGR